MTDAHHSGWLNFSIKMLQKSLVAKLVKNTTQNTAVIRVKFDSITYCFRVVEHKHISQTSMEPIWWCERKKTRALELISCGNDSFILWEQLNYNKSWPWVCFFLPCHQTDFIDFYLLKKRRKKKHWKSPAMVSFHFTVMHKFVWGPVR